MLAQTPLQSVDLQPGSAFFMPGGTWHSTAEQTSESLSLVVAVRAPSYLDVLQNLLAYFAGQAPSWRARTYGAWSTDPSFASAPAQELSRLLEELRARFDELTPPDAFKAWSAHGYAVGTQADYPMHLRFERYIRLPSSSVRFEDDAEPAKLRCMVTSGPTNRPRAQTVLAIEREARPVLDWILSSHAAFSARALCDALPDFDEEEVEALLGWLSRAALIRPVPAPEWDRS